ncbi:MAG: hypothetical protein MK003_10110 [Pseudomonadales bacterium]|nr:hypothetical protein [Pseudomonadales bacterium]
MFRFREFAGTVAFMLVILSVSTSLLAQLEPINNRPNPYVAVDGWANLPDERQWG